MDCYICNEKIISKQHYFSKEHIYNKNKLSKECAICNHKEVLFNPCTRCNNKWCLKCDDKIQKCPFCRLEFPVKNIRIVHNLISVTESNIIYLKDRIDELSLKLTKISIQHINLKHKKKDIGLSILKKDFFEHKYNDILEDIFILDDEDMYLQRRIKALEYSIRNIRYAYKKMLKRKHTLFFLKKQISRLNTQELFLSTKGSTPDHIFYRKKSFIQRIYKNLIKNIFYIDDIQVP